MRTGRPYRAVSSTEEGGEEEPAGMERWLLTYSDMITLLLALFVVLYALGSLNHVKYSEFAKGMNVSFNNGNSQPSSARTQPSKHPGDNPVEKYAASLGSVEAQLRGALIKAGLMKDVQLTVGPGGLVVGLITGRTYYGVDSAALSPLGAEVVDITGQVIRSHTNPVNVEGYTDNDPVSGGQFRNNHELSVARAMAIYDVLINRSRLQGDQLFVTGHGPTQPVVSNATAEGKQRNRRVELVIYPERKN